MEQISIGDILDQTVKRKATTAEMYTVRTGRKVLRNGQSASVYDRLEAHLGLDWRAEQKKCPACLKPIPVARPLSNWCPFCQRELYVSTTESLPKDNVLTAGTSLFLTMLQIPSSEASDTFKFLSPLLTVTPDRYFGLLIALTEEVGSYYAYSQQRLLQLCHQLGEDTVSLEVAEDDPYAIDSDVLLFHLLFSHWPERFFTFLDIIYDTVHLPLRPPGYLSFRWHWLLTKRWWLVTPRWLFDAFEEHEQRYRESEDF